MKGWENFKKYIRNENLGLFFSLTKPGIRWYFIFNIFILLGCWPCKGRVSSWVNSNFVFWIFLFIFIYKAWAQWLLYFFQEKRFFNYFLILDEKSLYLYTYWICNSYIFKELITIVATSGTVFLCFILKKKYYSY